MTDLDDPQALRLADPQGMLDAVLGMPNDCRAAYDSARLVEQLPSAEGVASVTFCGMGGSAVSGDVVRSVFLERLGLPVEVNRSPVLPEHCGSHTLVVCSSYSGNTAETLAAFRAALETRLSRAGRDVGRHASPTRPPNTGSPRCAYLPASNLAPRSGISGSRRSARSRPWGSCRRSRRT